MWLITDIWSQQHLPSAPDWSEYRYSFLIINICYYAALPSVGAAQVFQSLKVGKVYLLEQWKQIMRLKEGLKVLNRSVERGGFSCQSKALHLITGSAGSFILDTYVTSHTLIRQNSVIGRGLPNTCSMITQDTSSRHQTGLNSLFKKEKSQMKSSALLCSTLYCITAGLTEELRSTSLIQFKHWNITASKVSLFFQVRWTDGHNLHWSSSAHNSSTFHEKVTTTTKYSSVSHEYLDEYLDEPRRVLFRLSLNTFFSSHCFWPLISPSVCCFVSSWLEKRSSFLFLLEISLL